MPRDSRSRRRPVGFLSDEEYSAHDQRKYFQPTANFTRWMKARFSAKLIYDLGSGMEHVAKALAKTGLRVTAVDLVPRAQSAFPMIQANSAEFSFEKDSVVMFCRPRHSGFVEKPIAKAIQSRVSHILYVGLAKNLQFDLGSIHDRFTKRRVGMVGHLGECAWELNVKRLRANASMRRRGIPRLSSNFSL